MRPIIIICDSGDKKASEAIVNHLANLKENHSIIVIQEPKEAANFVLDLPKIEPIKLDKIIGKKI